MRVMLLVGAVVVALAVVIVPLPWSVSDPSRLRPVTDTVTVEVQPEPAQPRSGRGVSGEYLAVHHRERAAALHLLLAALASGPRIVQARPPVTRSPVSPLVAAAMSGLGVVPRHADAADIPVTVHVDAGGDAAGLGAALYAFDVGNNLDVARGRRIVGLGRVTDGGHLVCTTGVAQSVVAAAGQRVDVVVVPSDCVEDASAAVPHDAEMEVLEAGVLTGAVQALLGE